MNVALLLLRLLLSGIIFAHASQKLFGWFHGPGIAGASMIFERLGQQPARTMVLLAAVCEYAAACGTALGLLFPLSCGIAIGTMLVAGGSMMLVSGTFWNAAGGGEYPIVLAAIAAALAFSGPGRWSVDVVVQAPWSTLDATPRTLIAVVVILVAALAAVPPLVRARRSLRGRRAG
jgi:putative oxidoreductase